MEVKEAKEVKEIKDKTLAPVCVRAIFPFPYFLSLETQSDDY